MVDSNCTIEDLARNVAFEIELGGDRFSPSDLKEWLKGIPSKDLAIFRERVLLHAQDFAPQHSFYSDFTVRMVDNVWLPGVETAESLGRDVPSWYDGIVLHNDKGKYFLFDDSQLLPCEKLTAEAQWGRDVRSRILKEFTWDEAARYLADALIDRYGDQMNGKTFCDFITHAMLPEGNVVGILSGKEPFFVTDTDERISFSDAYSRNPRVVMDILNYEFDERVYREICEQSIRRQDVADFKKMASDLIDVLGERVSRDFLYDIVYLKNSDAGSICIMREVDDFSDNKRFYLSVEAGDIKKTIPVTEDIDAGYVSQLSAVMSEMLESLPVRDTVELSSGRINFADGPVVSVPEFGLDGPRTMKVVSLFSDIDGVPSVKGRLLVDGMETNAVYPLSMLSDKGVLLVREASDKALSRLQALEPKPSFDPSNKSAVNSKKVVKGGVSI